MKLRAELTLLLCGVLLLAAGCGGDEATPSPTTPPPPTAAPTLAAPAQEPSAAAVSDAAQTDDLWSFRRTIGSNDPTWLLDEAETA